MADLKSLFAQQDAARKTAPVAKAAPSGDLTPEERQELAGLMEQRRTKAAGARGNYATKQHGEVDTSMGAVGDFAGRMGRGFTSTLGAIPKGLGDLYEGTIGDNDTKGNILSELGQGIEDFGKRADINPEYNDTFAAKVGTGLGSAGAFLLPGGAVGAGLRAGTTAAKLASYGVPGVMGGLAGAHEQVADYEATTGEAPQDAAQRLRLAAMGLAGGATEALPFGRVLGRGFGGMSDDIIKGMANKAGKVTLGATAKKAGVMGAKGIVEEGGQEAFQTGLQNYVAKEVEGYDEERDLAEGLGDAAATGGTVGFIMNAALGAMGVRVRAKELGLTGKIEEGEEKLRGEAADKVAVENKTNQTENKLNAGTMGTTGTTGTTKKTGAPTVGVGANTQDYIVPGIDRKQFSLDSVKRPDKYKGGKSVQHGTLGGTMGAEEGTTFTAREIAQTSFKNIQTLSNYETATPGESKTFTASQRRDAEVLAALPEEEQQAAMDGKSESPAANKAAHVAVETAKVQKVVKEATEAVNKTNLSPAGKAKAVERRVEKGVKDLGYEIDNGAINIPDGRGYTLTEKPKPQTGEAPAQTTTETATTKKEPKTIEDERTPEQRAVDTNLDLVEAQFETLRGQFTSANTQAEKNKLEDDYDNMVASYTSAVMAANPKKNPDDVVKEVVTELKQLGIYHDSGVAIDAKTIQGKQVETEEAVADIVEKTFPVLTTGSFKGGRKGNNIEFPIKDMDMYRAALAERGLYAHKISQSGNTVKAWVGAGGKRRVGKDPFELATFDKAGGTKVDLKKVAAATISPDEQFFPNENPQAEQSTAAPAENTAEPAAPREVTPKEELIDLMSKQGKANLRKALDGLGIKYSPRAGPKGLATILYHNTVDTPEGVPAQEVAKPLAPDEEQFFGNEFTLTEKPKAAPPAKPATPAPNLKSPTAEALKGKRMSPAARAMLINRIESGVGNVPDFLKRPTSGKGNTGYTKKDVENYFLSLEMAEESKAFVAEREGTARKPEEQVPPEAEEFFGNFPSEEVTPPTKKSDRGSLTEQEKKKVEKEAEAMRKEIREIEEEGVPFDDDFFGDYDVSDGTPQPFDPRERQNRIAQYKTTWDKLSMAVLEKGAARVTEEKRAYRQFLADYAGTDGHPTGVAYEPSINFMTTSEVMDILVEGLPEGSAYKYLAQKLRGLDLDTTVSFDTDMQGKVHPSTGERMAPNGLFNDVDNTIKLNPKHLLERPNTGIKTLLHEVVHAATVRAIYNNPKFMSEVNTLMNTARTAAASRGVPRDNDNHHTWYGLTNESEFIAEMMTNVKFQKFLNTVYIRSSLTNKVTTLWKEFVASVARFIGVDVQLGSVLEASLQISERYMIAQSTKDMLLDKGQVIKQNKGQNLTDEIKNWEYNPQTRSRQRVKDAQLARTMSEYDLPAGSNPQGLQGNDLKKSKSLIEKYTKLAEKNGLKLHVSWDGSMNDMPTWVVDGTNVTKETKGRISLEDKSVAVFANNVTDYESFKRVMFHEVLGHFSMESLFGEQQYAQFVTNLSKSPQWGKEMALLKQEYASGGIEMNDLQAGKELIARMAETGVAPNLFNRVIAWVKHKLRSYGYMKDDITNNDIQSYIAKASKQFENGTLPDVDFQNPVVMNSFVNDLFSGSIQRGTDVDHSKKTMKEVVTRLFKVKNDIDEYQGSWSAAANDLYNSFSETKIARGYSALKDLPYKRVYNYVRQIGLGDSSAYDQRASQVWNKLESINEQQRSSLYTFFTKRDAVLPEDWGTAEQLAAAREAKQTIMDLGQELVDYNFLDEKVFEANKGEYLHTAYLAFMMNEDKAASIYGGGAKLSLQGYLKQKSLDDDTAKQALGWIEDPVLMASQSIAMVGRDVALLRMADAMSYSSNKMSKNMWMTPDVPGLVTVWSGSTEREVDGETVSTRKKMNPFKALEELAGLRKNVLNKSHPSKKPGLIKLYDEQEQMIRDHIAEWGAQNDYTELENIDMKQYSFVEHGKRNGAFSGRFIKKEIYNDVRASYAAFATENPGTVEKLIGQYGALTKVNRFWKNTKTVWNPPTHVRNFLGNFVNLDISTTTNSLSLGKMVGEEAKRYLEAIANNTSMEDMPYYWKVADKLGITETTFTAQEARQILSKWKTKHHGGKIQDWLDEAPDHAPTRWLKENMPQMRGGFQTIADLMGNTYQGSETLFKVVKLRDTMERYEKKLGRKISEITDDGERTALESMAVQDAQRWIFDYSAVPRSIRYLRNAPIGAPFISFAYLALPRMFEASMKHPVKIMKYMTLPYAVGQISAMAGAFGDNEGDDDWDTVKQRLPNYQKNKYSVMPMPWKDEYGNPVMWDLGYYVPFSPYVEAARSYTRKFITGEEPDMSMIDPIMNMGLLSGPIPDVLTALKSGEDPFTSKPIIREYGTPTEKIWDGMVYGWSTAAPTFLTDKGWAGKTLNVLTDSVDNYNPRTGERKESLGRATARLAGFTTNAVNTRDSRSTNMRYMKGQISKIKAAGSKEVKQARAAGRSPQELADIRKKYTDKIKVYRNNLSEYRRRSS